MSEIERYDCEEERSCEYELKAVMQVDPAGYYVRHADHLVYLREMRMDRDVERLRADTAGAELVSANADKEAYAQNAIDLRTSLDATTLNLKRADNLISVRTSENQQLRKLLEQTLEVLNPTAKLSKSIRAALNPNPEAESHE
jgi:hypothetical protein